MGPVLLLLLYFISTSVRWSLAQNSCEFYFSEQPPDSLSCDPYQQRQLKIECTVHGPVLADFELVWFTVRLEEGSRGLAAMVHNSSDVSIRSQLNQDGAVKRIRSRLQLQLYGDPSDTAFWCSVLARPGNDTSGSEKARFLPSEAFVLRVAEVYADLPVCSDTPSSSNRPKCATVSPSALQQPTLQRPPPATTTTLSTPTTQAGSTAVPTSSQQPVALSSTQREVLPEPSVLPPSENLQEGQAELGAIVFPIMAALAGAFASLSLLTCLYLHCHYKHKKGGSGMKQVVEATYHSYSLPSTLSSHHLKGLSPSHPLSSRRARSLKLEDLSVSSNDQYVEMEGAEFRARSYSSCPTLHRTGLPSSLSDYGSAKLGFSYEVPIPFHAEPEYATIPSSYVPYLIPIESNMEPRQPHSDSCVKGQESWQSCHGAQFTSPQFLLCEHPSTSAPVSPFSHDYEHLIHTSANSAYRELAVMVGEESDYYTVVSPQQRSAASGDYTILRDSDSANTPADT